MHPPKLRCRERALRHVGGVVRCQAQAIGCFDLVTVAEVLPLENLCGSPIVVVLSLDELSLKG
jgi:hypothetical protein